jgi:GntR family transcriptional regulator, histidine utilization repressor
MATGWQQVHDQALARIQSREWAPGALIPSEADLAREMGCARSTVNRALQVLADAGWLERRRRAGTRVALAPERRAQLAIPVLRAEIEARGAVFSHTILSRVRAALPPRLRAVMGLQADAAAQHLCTLYMADGRAFAHEDRWVNLDAAPGFADAALRDLSPNEWLVKNVAFAHGRLEYSAEPAAMPVSEHLDCPPGTPLMVLERTTFGPVAPVTWLRLTHAPGHRLKLQI